MYFAVSGKKKYTTLVL